MGIEILFISVGSMAGIGIVLALILVVADKKFAVKEDPRIGEAIGILPGANCGACGYPGCAAYATGIVEGNAELNLCKPGGAEVVEKLSELMGIEAVDAGAPKVARVFCSGGLKEAVRDKIYLGVKTCASANITGGEKACMYSCIGYGDCVRACPFNAMYMNDNGLPVVILDKCTGCGECVKACPRSIMQLTEYDEVVHVYCSSLDKGAVVRKICSAGCIACGICEKDDDTGAVKVIDNLARVDVSINKAPIKSTLRCPTKVIRISELRSEYKELYENMKKKAQELLETMKAEKAKKK